jgi:hypothetical protein
MSSVVIAGNTSGTVTLSAPDVAGTTTLTLPATTGTVLTSVSPASDLPSSIKGPAFSAYANSATSLSNGAFTKILYQVEEYDTNNNFASSRFTPTVAGYYQVNGASNVGGGTTAEVSIAVYKNGSNYKQGPDYTIASGAQYSQTISTLVYCNGSTDYIEIYLYVGTSGKSTGSGEVSVWFNGAMVRSA